mgnify:CR=1 FL=1
MHCKAGFLGLFDSMGEMIFFFGVPGVAQVLDAISGAYHRPILRPKPLLDASSYYHVFSLFFIYL